MLPVTSQSQSILFFYFFFFKKQPYIPSRKAVYVVEHVEKELSM